MSRSRWALKTLVAALAGHCGLRRNASTRNVVMAEEISYHLSEDQGRVNGKKGHKAYCPNLIGSLRIITTTTTAKAIE